MLCHPLLRGSLTACLLTTLLLCASGMVFGQNAPTGGTTTPLLWLKADAGVTGDGGATPPDQGAVHSWGDQSGHRIELVQTDPARRPVWVKNAINGHPAVRFTYQAAQHVNLETSALASGAGSYTGFAVVRSSLTAGSSGAWIFDSQSGRLVLAVNHDGPAYGWYDGGYHYLGGAVPGWQIVEWALTAGGSGEVLVNGASQGTQPYTPQPIGGVTSLGGAYDTNGAPLNGDVAEMILYNTALSAAERGKLRAALAAKYGLTLGAAPAPSASAASQSALPANATAIPPDSPALLYSPYNWQVTSTAAKTINSGAYFRTRINSTTTCAIGLSIGVATPYSQVYARLDGGNWQQYKPKAAGAQDWPLVMPSPTTARSHLLEFVIKSTTESQDRWFNQATAVQFTGLTLDQGGSVSPVAPRKYRVLIYGDSITEGVRVNGYDGIPDDTDRNDVTKDYSYALGQLLDAEIGVVGFGATGMTAGGSGGVPPLSSSYNQLWAGQPRQFTPMPDLVIYNEGTNESGASLDAMKAAFVTVVSGIGYQGSSNTFAGFNGTRHLLLRPFNGSQAANLQAIVASFGSPNVVYGDTSGFWSGDEASDGLHPYAYAHLGEIAPHVAALALDLLRNPPGK